MSQITSTVVLHTQRPLQNGVFPIRLRIYNAPQRRYFSLPFNEQEMMYATEEEWDKIHSPKPRGRHKEMKLKIAAFEQRAIDVIKAIAEINKPFSFERFELRYFGQSNLRTVFTFFEKVIQDRRDDDQIGTADSYLDALRKFKKFRKEKDLQFSEVDAKLLKKFDMYMRAEGRSVSTIGIYMRSLRTIYNEAIDQGLVRQECYPFVDYKAPSSRKKKRALTKQAVFHLMAYELPPQSAAGRAKGFFEFSYLMQGMNFTDIAYLQNQNIINGRIDYYRRKTVRSVSKSRLISIKITPQIQILLDQLRDYDNLHDPYAYVFPVLQPEMNAEEEKATIKQFIKTTNKYLKRIGKELNFPLTLTTYVARHSFATVLKRQGAPTAIIGEMLAHTSEQQTLDYLDDFEYETKDKFNELLL